MSVTLSCPGCHARHRFRGNIAVDKTVYVRCPACGHMMMISPEINNPSLQGRRSPEPKESAPLPPEIAAAMAAARANLWRFARLELHGEELDSEQVVRLIKEGRLEAADLIAHADQNDWKPVDDIPEFAPALALAARAAAVVDGVDESGEPSSAHELESDEPVGPPSLGELFLYPVTGPGLITMGANALFITLASLSVAAGALLFFTFAYAYAILRASAEGATAPPGWEVFTDMMELFGNALRTMLVTVVAWSPLLLLIALTLLGPLASLQAGPATFSAQVDVADPAADVGELTPTWLPFRYFSPSGVMIAVIVTILVMIYFPMCLGLLAATGRTRDALNPIRVLRGIRDTSPAYPLTAGLGLGLLFICAGANLIFVSLSSRFGVPFVALLPTAVVGTYAAFMELHLLGRLVHDAGLTQTTV